MNQKESIHNALGALAPLYDDPEVTEIMVDGPESVVIERNGKLKTTELKFDSADEIIEIIKALLAVEGRTLAPDAPKVEVGLPGRMGRALAVLPPTATTGPYLVIRRYSEKRITWEMILEFGVMTPEAKELIQQAVDDQANILVAGGAFSGKTTLMNRVAELIPPDQRVVIVEELQELRVDHPRAVYMEAGEPPRLSFEDAVFTGSLMRPDWMVFSEIYGPAGVTILEILSHGHTGIATVHGNSAEETLARLEALCLKHNPGLGPLEIRNLISAAFNLVLCQRYLSDGRRKVTEIVEICGVENGRYVLQRLFRFNPETYRLEPTGVKPKWGEDF
jgi:pilus assembly protein CpaF